MKNEQDSKTISDPAVASSDLLAAYIRRTYTIARKCWVEDEPDAHTVVLKVGNQSFVIGALACETLHEAEWTRTMLANGLANLARESMAANGKISEVAGRKE